MHYLVMTQDVELLVNMASFNFVDTTFKKAASSETAMLYKKTWSVPFCYVQ